MFKLTLALAAFASLTGCRVVNVGPGVQVPNLNPGDVLNVTDVDQDYCDWAGGDYEADTRICHQTDF